METNTQHTDLKKLEKFNFFKRSEFSNQTKIGFSIAFLKTILKPINYFVTLPAILYILLKPKFPQQSLNIANEILTIPSRDLISLSLAIFGIILVTDLIKQTIKVAEDGQKVDKEWSSMWLPIQKTVEIGVLLFLVPVLWSVIWPIIR